MADPLAALLQSHGLAPLGPVRRRQQPLLTPEEEESLIERALGGGISTLSYIGSTLDKLGRPVRAGAQELGELLGLARPEDTGNELLSWIPFSDTLGITDAGDTLAGRDLLENYGLLSKNREGFSPIDDPLDALGDVAGFGAEVALDPASWLTFGAATAAGKAAKAAGTATRGLGPGIKAGERALVSFQAPFTSATRPLFGYSSVDEAGEVIAESPLADPLSSLGESVLSSAPVRGFRSLLDPRLEGAVSRADQKVMEAAYYAKQKGRPKAVMEVQRLKRESEPLLRALNDLLKAEGKAVEPQMHSGFNYGDVVQASDRNNFGRVVGATDSDLDVLFVDPKTGSQARVRLSPKQLKVKYRNGEIGAEEFGEGMTRSILSRLQRMTAETGSARESAEFLGLPELTDDLVQGLEGIGDDVVETNRVLRDEYEDWGGEGRRIAEMEALGETGRDFRHFPRYVNREGLEQAGARILDPTTASSKSRNPLTGQVPGDVLNEIYKDEALRVGTVNRSGKGGKKIEYTPGTPEERAEALSHLLDRYGRYLNPNHGQVLDEAGNVVTAGSKQAHAEEILDYVQTQSQAFVKGKLDKYGNQFLDDELKYLVQGNQAVSVMKEVHGLLKESLGSGTLPLKDAFKTIGMNPERALAKMSELTGQSVDALAKQGVDEEMVRAISGIWKTFDDPEWAKGIGKVLDKITRFYKQNLTMFFPSFYTRNFVGAHYLNFATGHVETPSDVKLMAQSAKEAYDLAQKGGPELDELAAYNVIHERRASADVPFLHRPGVQPGPVLKRGAFKDSLKLARTAVEETDAAIDKLPLGRKARTGYNTALATGSKVSEHVEFSARVTLYKYLKKKGWTPEAAAEETNRIHFDYFQKSPFERKAMSRLVPFWTFSARVMPLTIRTMLERPGGVMGQTIRGTQALREDAPYTPDYIEEGIGAYLGGDRFLTKLGLPIEDPLGRLVIGPTAGNTIGRTLEKNFASATPLVTGPYAFASGREPFFGRETTDLYPYPTESATLNTLLSKSPASRFITSYRTATDERKDIGDVLLNLGTGFDLTDVSGGLERARLRDADRALDILASESPNLGEFSSFYAPQGAELTSQDEELLLLAKTLNKRRKELAELEDEEPVNSLAGLLSR